jgi:ubiquinone/menaquinone biosynthesis C-methylase UbiE
MDRRMLSGSVSFDRAADIYDATRALPDAVERSITDALSSEIAAAGTDHVLEIGVGTGRISRPLTERGVRVCGVDISPRMLARLREQLGLRHLPPDLALGDATRLPLQSGSFRAVLVFNVLHLVSSLDEALGELRRVLAPSGVALRGVEEAIGESLWDASMTKWNELMAARDFSHRAGLRTKEIPGVLRAAGGSCRIETVIEHEEQRRPTETVDRIRRRIDSWTWELPDDLFADCLKEYEKWASRHYRDLERELPQRTSYGLEIWTFG